MTTVPADTDSFPVVALGRRGSSTYRHPARNGWLALMTIRESIKAAVQNRGLSISELSRAAGVHRGHLSEYLAGHRDMNTDTASRVMAALQMTIGGEVATASGPASQAPA